MSKSSSFINITFDVYAKPEVGKIIIQGAPWSFGCFSCDFSRLSRNFYCYPRDFSHCPALSVFFPAISAVFSSILAIVRNSK